WSEIGALPVDVGKAHDLFVPVRPAKAGARWVDVGVEHVDVVILREIGIEGEADHPGLGLAGDDEVVERLGLELAILDDANVAGPKLVVEEPPIGREGKSHDKVCPREERLENDARWEVLRLLALRQGCWRGNERRGDRGRDSGPNGLDRRQ